MNFLDDPEKKAYLWDVLVANTFDMVAIVDREGRFYFANRLAPGYNREEVMNAKVFNFIAPEYETVFKEVMEKVFRTGNPQVLQVRARGSYREFTNYKTQLCPVKLGSECDCIMVIAKDLGNPGNS